MRSMLPWLAACLACRSVSPAPATAVAPGPGAEVEPTAQIVVADDAEPPPIVDPVGAPIVVVPSEPGASTYGGAPEPYAAQGLEADVLALVRPRTHAAQLDTRLSRAAAQLAAIAPESGELGDGVVEYMRQRFGIAEPDPTLLVVRGDPDARAPAMLRLRQRLSHEMLEAPAIRIGVGIAPGRGERAIAVLISRSSIALEPVPRSLPVGGSFTLEADLDRRMRDPELVVTTSARRGISELVGGAGRRVTAVVECGQPGRLEVEFAATNPRGRLALARVPIWCGVEPPARYTMAPLDLAAGVTVPAQAERRLIALVNHDRRAAGVAPLRVDPQLVEAARRRAELLRESPRSATPLDDRSVEPGVSASGAAGRGVAAIYEALANDPSARARMLAPEWTHLGFGAAESAQELFVSTMYMAIPPRIDREQAARAIASHLTRTSNVAVNSELSDIARRFAAEVATGRSEAAIWEELKPDIDRAGRLYVRISYSISRTRSLDVDHSARMLKSKPAEDVGVGVAQLDHPTFGRRAIWTVVFWATRLGLRGGKR